MGLFDFLFGKKKKMTLEEANELNKEFIAKNPQAKNDEDALMRQASSLLTSGKFQESLDIYTKLADEYPQKRGLYLSQIGANYYFLGDYQKAIDFYLQARENDMDANMMDDNIWEACEAIYKQTANKDDLAKYEEYCPEGRYLKKMTQLLAR